MPKQPEKVHVAKKIRALAWLSLGYIIFESAAGIMIGLTAGSIALLGFGVDSLIEALSSIVVIWRFAHHRVDNQDAESRATQIIAILFFLLAPWVAFESINALMDHHKPEHSLLGIGLAASSLVVMPLLGVAKQRLAKQIGSEAAHGDGRQNLLCSYLAGAVLAGLLGNTLFGAWWLDGVSGLFISVVAIKEGWDTWQGRGCACSH